MDFADGRYHGLLKQLTLALACHACYWGLLRVSSLRIRQTYMNASRTTSIGGTICAQTAEFGSIRGCQISTNARALKPGKRKSELEDMESTTEIVRRR